jgi:uncharacterized protein
VSIATVFIEQPCASGPDHARHPAETVTVTASSGAAAPAMTSGAGTTTVTVSPAAPAGTSGPSFDCAKADSEAEKMVCGDPELAKLDRQLADEYTSALSRPGADTATLHTTQNGWVSGRDDCWNEDDVHGCVLDGYRTRIFELRTSGGAVPAPPVVSCQCPGDKAFTAQFYDGFDPKAAVLKWGEDSAVTFAEPTGRGTQYGRSGVEFSEHRGEVKVNFYGNEFTCRTS